MKRFCSVRLMFGAISLLIVSVTGCSTPTTIVPTLPAVAPALSPEEVVATNVAIQRAIEATLTAVPSPGNATAEAAPSPSPTLTSMPTTTPSQLPVTAPPSRPTLTLTPRVDTPKPPKPLEPAQGGTYKNPITFQWSGSLGSSDKYQVTARHVETGYTLQSGLLTDLIWSTDVPANNTGEWRWKVLVIRNGAVLATSAERMFWFNPFPKTPGSPPIPTMPAYPYP